MLPHIRLFIFNARIEKMVFENTFHELLRSLSKRTVARV